MPLIGPLIPPAQDHGHAAFRVELDDRVAALVDHPDVVLGIDAHAMTEHVAVELLPDLPHVVAVRVELERLRLLGAAVDEDMPLRVAGDPDAFAQIHVRGQLHEVAHDLELDIGRVDRPWA